MNRTFTKLTGVGVALALCLMGTIAWVNAQAVTDSMLLADPAESWLHTNGNLAGHRYSVLTQLNTSNVADLKVAWIFSQDGKTDAQTTPLYHDGLVYFAQDNTVFAIDAGSGRWIWKYEHELPETFGGYNVDFITGQQRGIAIYGDAIYFLSNDAVLHAIHYRTGEQKFQRLLQYPKAFSRADAGDQTGYAVVGPMAIPGQIIVPLTATDFGGLPGSGSVYGVNPEDGEVLWECNMIPGEPGYESRSGDRAEHSTGPLGIGSWDPELRLYYTSAGNSTKNVYPWNPTLPGDGRFNNLGAASVVACSTDNGRTAWRHDMVLGGPLDLNTAQTPMVIDIDDRKSIVHPDGNGSIHYLDAQTGEKFPRTLPPYADPMNLNEGYDEIEAWPHLVGDVNMRTYSNVYNPLNKILYLTATNAGMKYEYEEIKFIGNNVRHLGTSVEFTRGYVEPAILAVDVKSGAEIWREQNHAGSMLTTAGNLVFYTSQAGVFHAKNATTGETLYDLGFGMTPKSGPITYMLDGKQYVVQLVGGVPGWGIEERHLDHDSMMVALSR